MANVFIAGGSDINYYRLFTKDLGFTLVNVLDDANLVVFTGGADVDPQFYGAHTHPTTFFNTDRDVKEERIYMDAQKKGIPMVGICRGAQFLNVMNGGELYQDVTDHALAGGHMLFDHVDQRDVYVSSTHHQMMKPHANAIILATAALAKRKTYWNKERQVWTDDLTQKDDIEVVYYSDTQCLCFQPHPEFAGAAYADMRAYFKMLLDRFLIKIPEMA